MEISDFKNILEVQSLEIQIEKHLQATSENQSRIDYLSKKLEEKEIFRRKNVEKLKMIKSEIGTLEKDLFECDKKIDQQKSAQNQILSEKEFQALALQLEKCEVESSDLSEKILELLDTQEEIEEKIKRSDSFINGILETILEVKNEVYEKNSDEQNEIRKYQKRISLLVESTDKSLYNLYLKTKAITKKMACAFLVNNLCGQCKFTISKEIIDLIEKKFKIETCPCCYRILIPESVKN